MGNTDNNLKVTRTWDPVFKAGTHTSSNGVTRKWTHDDLDQLVANTGPDAPIVIRHPEDQDNAANFGKIARLRRVGKILQAQYRDIPEILNIAVKQGLNLAKSLSIDPVRMQIRHIGLLGAGQDPAVDGLGPASFSADSGSEGETLLTYQTHFEKEGTVDPKDKKIQELESKIRDLEAGKETQALQDKLDHAEDALKKEKDAHDATKAEFSKFKQEQEDQALQDRVDALADSGRIRAGEKKKVLSFAKAMAADDATMEFSAPDGTKEAVTPRENYLRDLEAREPDRDGLLSEFARGGGGDTGDKDGVDLAGLADRV